MFQNVRKIYTTQMYQALSITLAATDMNDFLLCQHLQHSSQF